MLMEWMRRWGEGFGDGAAADMEEIIRRGAGARRKIKDEERDNEKENAGAQSALRRAGKEASLG